MFLTRAEPGKPFRPEAAAWNAFIDGLGNGAGSKPSEVNEADWYGGDVVWVYNYTGGTLDKHDIVGVGNPLLSPDGDLTAYKAKPIFYGETPSLLSHWNKPAVVLEPIPAGFIGPARMTGIIAAKVDVQHKFHRAVDIKVGSTSEFQSYATGSGKILSNVSELSTGSQWCMVQLGFRFVGPLYGKTDAAHLREADGTISIYNVITDVDTTYDVTALNLFADLDINSRVLIHEIFTRYVIGSAEYPVVRIGLTDEDIAFETTGTVSRLTPGTEVDTGINDECRNIFIETAEANRYVAYAAIGGVNYLVAYACGDTYYN